jgi:tetratricopeptide (TPR) repeat protein
VVAKSLFWISAILLAVGLVTAPVLLGGWWYPALAGPGYLLVGAAAIVAGLMFWRATDAPGAVCVGSVILFAAYLLWRQAATPDWYAAREDAWLLLGALSVYLTVAWQLRGDGPRGLVLGLLFVLTVSQVILVAAQFTADSPFHPLADLARSLGLPRGDEQVPNQGWVSGTLANRAALSGVLEVTTFLALGLLVWGRGGVAVKLLLLWVAAAGFAGLALCLSRSAYLGVPAGLGVFALVSFFVLRRGATSHRVWLGAGALLLVALAVMLGLLLGGESTTVRLRFNIVGLDEYRERLWFITVPPMLTLDPWFGAGANIFDQLSQRYRGTGFLNLPVHAHNDWLQLLIEYGRLGFVLGVMVFLAHFAAGWRNALRLARELPPDGLLPQATPLGLATGSLAGLTALGVHAFFDYSLHVPAVALLAALCAGWLAATRAELPGLWAHPLPRWLRPLAILTALPGVALVWWVARELPAERLALEAENAWADEDPRVPWDLAHRGLALSPANPRLLTLAAGSAGLLGNASATPAERLVWTKVSADYYGDAVRERPDVPFLLREHALGLDRSGRPDEALPVYLRAIARDPDHARGYEYLAQHYWSLGRRAEAIRLFRLAQKFTGSQTAAEYLRRAESARE